MKKLTMMFAAAVAAATLTFTGCDTSETLIIAGANTAGNLGLSAWFAIDDPDCQVKETLKEIVTSLTESSDLVVSGGSYVDALAPAIQAVIARHDNLTAAQKNLINTGAAVILGGLDTFLASNEKVKTNATLVSKIVAAFGKGCLTAISRSDTCSESVALAKAHHVIRMKYVPEARAFALPDRK